MSDCCEQLLAEVRALRGESEGLAGVLLRIRRLEVEIQSLDSRFIPVAERQPIIDRAVSITRGFLLSLLESYAKKAALEVLESAVERALNAALGARAIADTAHVIADRAGEAAAAATSQSSNALSKALAALNLIATLAASLATLNILGARIDAVEDGLARLGNDVSYILSYLLGLRNKVDEALRIATDALNRVRIPGERGERGLTGEPGEQGDRGERGLEGEPGAPGDRGERGERGVVGLTGAKGDQGERGAPGDRGERGERGVVGLTGAKGQTGDKGRTGDRGERGDRGQTGTTGRTGDRGDRGQTGANGNTGATGAKGSTGATGAKGAKGDKGDKGAKGDKGDKSTIAIQNIKTVGLNQTGRAIRRSGTASDPVYDLEIPDSMEIKDTNIQQFICDPNGLPQLINTALPVVTTRVGTTAGLYVALFGEVAKILLKLGCKEQEPLAIAAVPEWWQVRIGADRPQMVIMFGQDLGNGKVGRNRYPLTIPHYIGALGQQPNIPKYNKGQWEGILTLNDNSKLIVNASTSGEAEKVINACKTYINRSYLQGSFMKIGQRKGQILKRIKVTPCSGKFFSTGQKDTMPDWVVSFR